MFWLSFGLFALDRLPVFAGNLEPVSPGQLPALAWSVTASQLGTFAVLLAARATYLSTARARRHPAWTVLTFLVAAFIGDVLGSRAAAWAEPVLGTAPTANALSNAWVEALALCVIGIVLAAYRQHRSQVTDLLTAQERLLATRRSAEEVLAQERERVVDTLVSSVTTTMHGMTPADPVGAAASLRRAAQEVVRPLSHDLVTRPPDFTPVPSVELRPAPWRTVLAEVPATPLIAPLPMAIVGTLLAGRLTIQTPVTRPAPTAAATTVGPLTVSADLGSLLEAVLALTAIFAAIWLSAVIVLRRSAPMVRVASAGRRWIVALGGIALIGVASQLLIGASSWLPGMPAAPDLSLTTHVLLVLPLLLIAIVVGAIRAITIRQRSLREELTETNAGLAWEVARTNESIWQQRRQLAQIVHVRVQAALNAGAIAIDARPGELDEGTLDRVRAEVGTALERLSLQEGPSIDPEEAITETQQLWADVCRIEVTLPALVHAGRTLDPVAAATLVQIVNEACANAVIHGHATDLSVQARVVDDRAIDLTITDNGRVDHVDGRTVAAGLGTQFLDDVSIHWTRQSQTSGTTLSVRLPAPFNS